MAVTKHTPKDVGSYESKLIGPFTQRQSLCLGIGAVPAVFAATLLGTLGMDGYSIAAVCVIIMIIPGFLAFGSKLCYGMKPEDFLIEYYTYHIKSKNVRLYETKTLDDKLDVIRKKEQKEEAQKLGIEEKKPKKNKKKEIPVTKTKFKDERFTPHGHKESKEYRTFC